MPKTKKSAGRPNPSFDPRYAAKKHGKPGPKSPKHRGYRAEEAPASGKKQRWNAEERAARRPSTTGGRADSARGVSADRAPYSGDRFSDRRDDRPSDRRAERPYQVRGQRPADGERMPRRDHADGPHRDEDRAPRRNEDHAPRREYENRAPRRDYENGAPRRDRDDRAPRRDYENRAPRRDHDDRAPRREYENRAPRRDHDDRVLRREYENRAPRRDHDDRVPRREYENRAPRRDHDNRAPRRDFDDRAPRKFDDRPQRSFSDRPRRDFSDRPRRDHSERPRWDDSRTSRPRERFAPEQDVVLERLEAVTTVAGEVDGLTFGDLGLGDNLVRQLSILGAERPFPIQAATVPDVLAGKNVLGRGRTGSGKTIAFGAPLVERLLVANHGVSRKQGRAPRALILAPTRELAMQIDRTVQPLARCVGLFTATIVGGVPQHSQNLALRRGVDILVATPGRLEDLVRQGRLDLSTIMITVIDEADHMCDLGFLEPVQNILRQTDAGGQRLLFSATLDSGVATLIGEFLTDPAVHEVAGEDQASSTIDHRILLIDHRDKRDIVKELAAGDGKTLVFTRTRAFAEELADQLEDAGIRATSLHGDLNQSRRTRNLQQLTSGRVSVLVATDVAARGIHIDDISLVIQADAPTEYKSYLHRAGRTGRAGKAGTVVTLVSRSGRRRVEELLGRADITADVQFAAPGDAVLGELAAL